MNQLTVTDGITLMSHLKKDVKNTTLNEFYANNKITDESTTNKTQFKDLINNNLSNSIFFKGFDQDTTDKFFNLVDLNQDENIEKKEFEELLAIYKLDDLNPDKATIADVLGLAIDNFLAGQYT